MKHRIVVGLLVPALMLIATGLLARRTINALLALNPASQVPALLDAISAGDHQMRAAALLAARTGQDAGLRSYQASRDQLQKTLSTLQRAASDPDQRLRAATLAQLLASELAYTGRLVRQRRDLDPYRSLEGRRLAADIENLLAEMNEAERALIRRRQLETVQDAHDTLATTAAGTIFALLFALLVAISLSRDISDAVRQFAVAADRIAKGTMGYRPEVSAGQELADLPAAFNRMAELLEQSEQDVQRYSRLLRSVLLSMRDGVIVADQHGRFLFFNPAAEQILGYGPTDEAAESWPGFYGFHLSEGGARCAPGQMPLVQAIRGLPTDEVELFVRNPRVPDGKWLKVSATPLTDEQGRVWAGVAVLADITSRRNAELALRDSEQRFRSFVETTNEWIWSLDGEGALTYSNPAIWPILGYMPQEVVGSDIGALLHPDDRAQFTDWLPSLHAASGSLALSLRWRHQHGTYRYLEANAVPILGDAGNVIGYHGTARDITLRQLADQQINVLNDELRNRITALDAANKELEAFSYSVSHDLRAPLRSIDGFSQALLEDYHDRLDDDGKDYLRRVRAASQRMAQLIDDLLNLSRVARHEIQRTNLSLTRIARSVLDELRQSQPGREVQLSIADGLEANADERLLRIALENLLGNAWKFTRHQPQAHIAVRSFELDGETVYCVQDNGVGFDMTYADKLFGAFQRMHSADEFEGTGIGLAIVQRIMTRHGGRIWADAAVGHGAQFFFTLGQGAAAYGQQQSHPLG